MMTVFVSIGNTDNRLTQQQWADYYARVDREIRDTVGHGGTVHGRWVSPSTDPYQNACWAFTLDDDSRGSVRRYLRGILAEIAGAHEQDSVAWTEGAPEFINAKP